MDMRVAGSSIGSLPQRGLLLAESVNVQDIGKVWLPLTYSSCCFYCMATLIIIWRCPWAAAAAVQLAQELSDVQQHRQHLLHAQISTACNNSSTRRMSQVPVKAQNTSIACCWMLAGQSVPDP